MNQISITDPTNAGSQIRGHRAAAHMKQEELAKRAGMTRSRLSRIERLQAIPTDDEMEALSNALSGCSPVPQERLATDAQPELDLSMLGTIQEKDLDPGFEVTVEVPAHIEPLIMTVLRSETRALGRPLTHDELVSLIRTTAAAQRSQEAA